MLIKTRVSVASMGVWHRSCPAVAMQGTSLGGQAGVMEGGQKAAPSGP